MNAAWTFTLVSALLTVASADYSAAEIENCEATIYQDDSQGEWTDTCVHLCSWYGSNSDTCIVSSQQLPLIECVTYFHPRQCWPEGPSTTVLPTTEEPSTLPSTAESTLPSTAESTLPSTEESTVTSTEESTVTSTEEPTTVTPTTAKPTTVTPTTVKPTTVTPTTVKPTTVTPTTAKPTTVTPTTVKPTTVTPTTVKPTTVTPTTVRPTTITSTTPMCVAEDKWEDCALYCSHEGVNASVSEIVQCLEECKDRRCVAESLWTECAASCAESLQQTGNVAAMVKCQSACVF